VRRHQLGLALTGNTATFAAVLIAIWYAGSSQQNSAAYLLLFALISAAIVSLPQTLSNVIGLTARAEAIKPTFAGQEATLSIELINESRADRRGLRLRLPEKAEGQQRVDELASGKAARAALRFPTPIRGEHELKTVSVESAFPLGLIRITRHLEVNQRYLVYPKPAGDPMLPQADRSPSRHGQRRDAIEGHDFAGVRAYVPGESQRQVDWKAVARGQPMMTKQFAGEAEPAKLYLDLATAPGRNLEDRISQMTLWVIQAERSRRQYGLRLPDLEVSISLGELHLQKCLRALALVGSETAKLETTI
jgi:uncharacterized protein (DUF58 family)